MRCGVGPGVGDDGRGSGGPPRASRWPGRPPGTPLAHGFPLASWAATCSERPASAGSGLVTDLTLRPRRTPGGEPRAAAHG